MANPQFIKRVDEVYVLEGVCFDMRVGRSIENVGGTYCMKWYQV